MRKRSSKIPLFEGLGPGGGSPIIAKKSWMDWSIVARWWAWNNSPFQTPKGDSILNNGCEIVNWRLCLFFEKAIFWKLIFLFFYLFIIKKID
jgi:hypothetical protein